MATSEILNLAPQAVWKHFYELTQDSASNWTDGGGNKVYNRFRQVS